MCTCASDVAENGSSIVAHGGEVYNWQFGTIIIVPSTSALPLSTTMVCYSPCYGLLQSDVLT